MTFASRGFSSLSAVLWRCRSAPVPSRLSSRSIAQAAHVRRGSDAVSWRAGQVRKISTTISRPQDDDAKATAKELSQKSVDEEENAVKRAKRKQEEKPWHRKGHEAEPPSSSVDPTHGDPTKGRLLTTPTRLLKLILPLPQLTNRTKDDGKNALNKNNVQPLALLVHPQQPLSYLERLLQAEVPPIKVNGNERIPNIEFHAEAERSKKEQTRADEKENVESYSGLGHEGPRKHESNWVRWSTSTELGDFIRDAARGREFSIGIEGYDRELRVAVPSFNDRTYYMRIRLRKMSRQIDQLANLKKECDMIAHQGAHRMAKAGFGLLTAWWGVVYYASFHTQVGWDLVEPVTYLVGLTTIMGGYLYFLYISKDLNYRAILNVSVSRRQNALYQEKGFELAKWEKLAHRANALRDEIRMVATEYDVDWDETSDLGGEQVKELLEEEKKEERDMDEKQKRESEKAQRKAAHEKDGKHTSKN